MVQPLSVVCAIWVGSCASACGGSVPTATRWRPAPDTSADHAVLYLSSDCSAVAVGPTTLLTAAHCVSDPGPLTARVAGQRVLITACAVHPEAYARPRDCGAGPGPTRVEHDLALLTLERPLASSPPPILLTAPLRPTWWRRRSVRLVGWDRRPRIVGPLGRRSGENHIVRMGGSFTTSPEGRHGFSTVIGDSGGAALLRMGGQETLIGILSGGTAPGSRESVFVPTFEPENARWLLSKLPDDVGRDLPAIAAPSARPQPTA